MKNLEQIRAANAPAFWKSPPAAVKGAEGGNVISKLPAMLINNGLLATASLCPLQEQLR